MLGEYFLPDLWCIDRNIDVCVYCMLEQKILYGVSLAIHNVNTHEPGYCMVCMFSIWKFLIRCGPLHNKHIIFISSLKVLVVLTKSISSVSCAYNFAVILSYIPSKSCFAP